MSDQKPIGLCPNCGHKTAVVDARGSTLPGVLATRRRECVPCDMRITTYEVLQLDDLQAKRAAEFLVSFMALARDTFGASLDQHMKKVMNRKTPRR